MRIICFILASLTLISPATANDLANKTIEYTYIDGSSVILSLDQKTLNFEWLSGPFKGVRREGLYYRWSRTREDQFLIKWNDQQGNSFVTLLIDLREKTVNGSAIIGYVDAEPTEIFDKALITQVSEKD